MTDSQPFIKHNAPAIFEEEDKILPILTETGYQETLKMIKLADKEQLQGLEDYIQIRKMRMTF